MSAHEESPRPNEEEAPAAPDAPGAPELSGTQAAAEASEPSAGPSRPRWLPVAGTVAVVALAAGVGLAAGRAGGDDDGGPTGDAAGTSEEAGSGSGSAGTDSADSFAAERGAPGTRGTIEEIDGSTLTLATAEDDTVEVLTSDDTTITDTSEGSFDDLAVGDNVIITGSGTEEDAADDGTVAASRVVDSGDLDDVLQAGGPFGGGGTPPDGFDPESMPEGMPEGLPEDLPEDFDPGSMPELPAEGGASGGAGRPGGFTSGTIASIDGDTFTVTTADGDTVTVSTTADTEVLVVTELSLDDLATGDEVTVAGTADDDADEGDGSSGTITAASIRRGEDTFGFAGGVGGPPPEAAEDETSS